MCWLILTSFKKIEHMSGKNKKQFGVWMDSHHAVITGREHIDNGDFVILGMVENPAQQEHPSNEHTANNKEIGLTHKFFKEIAAKMPNVDAIHVTGTGQIQEEFLHYLAETPQYKNAVSSESTSTKMGNEQLTAFITDFFG
jgi:stalled ribosome rescue protein Dom34